MNNWKQYKTRESIKTVFDGAATIATLMGFLFYLIDKNWAVVLWICLGLLTLALIISYCITLRQRKENPDEDFYISFSSNSLTAIDEEHYTYDVYKTAQCKRFFMSSARIGLKWTGKEVPKFSSKLQNVGKYVKGKGRGNFDYVDLKLKKHVFYNQVTTLHLHADMKDTERRSRPYLYFNVVKPIAVIMFNVTLRYKPDDYHESAVMEKIPIDKDAKGAEVLGVVAFDQIAKNYTYVLANPEPGYTYRMRWEK